MENLNSELSNNNIEQLKEKFNSGLNKIDIEKIWISNHKNLEKIYINLEEIRKYIQEYKSTFLLSPKRKKLKEEINKYFDSKKMSQITKDFLYLPSRNQLQNKFPLHLCPLL